ncbi:MAG: hypothetical protein EHM43_01470 [Ignavibacteriae bacterium]|nr:MAG: hypothetical protein EHM43_01470 [Ignavibacteriota bacterium]
MVDLTLEWAQDVARVLKRRNLVDSGSASSKELQSLLHALLDDPIPLTWTQAVQKWKSAGVPAVKRKSQQRRVQRARELLTRAMAGLNTEHLRGAAQFRFHTRVTNELTTAQMLLDAGFHQSARVMYTHAYELSNKHELTDCSIRALKYIRKIDAAKGDRGALRKIDGAINRLRKILELELEAESLQDHARALLENFTRNRPSSIKQLNGILARLKQLSSRADATSLIILSRYRTELWLASTTRDSERIFRVGSDAVSYLNNHPYAESVSYRVEFEGSRMTAMLSEKDYEGALAVWEDVSPRLSEGAANWVQLLQVLFLASTLTRHYNEAREFLLLYEAKRKHGGPEWRIHRWQLYRAYILFLAEQNIIDPHILCGAPRMYAVNLEKHIKELHKDKAVAGAAVFILKILQWLRSRRYTEVIGQVEWMRQYAYRYLSDTQTVRTGVFLRMLAAIPTADFDPSEARRRGAAIMAKHTAMHEVHRDSAEIVPYEDLWEIAMRILETNIGTRGR